MILYTLRVVRPVLAWLVIFGCFLSRQAFATEREAAGAHVVDDAAIACLMEGADEKSHDPKPYLLPKDHPLYATVASLFRSESVIKDDHSLESAGFDILFKRKRNNLRVLRHKKVRGYVFKLYTIADMPRGRSAQGRLVERCKGALAVQKIIDNNNIRHFTVPKKWLFALPSKHSTHGTLYVVIAQDMHLKSRAASIKAWKTKITPDHLSELYILFKTGYGSMAVDQNIAYTKDKTFTFIDLEYPPRKFELSRLERFLSQDMWEEWKKIIGS